MIMKEFTPLMPLDSSTDFMPSGNFLAYWFGNFSEQYCLGNAENIPNIPKSAFGIHQIITSILYIRLL